MYNLHFAKSYRTILTTGRNCGLPLPWLDSGASRATKTMHKFYEIFMAIFLIFKIICGIYSIFNNEKFDEIVYSFSLTTYYSFGFFLILFYSHRGDSFIHLIQDLDELTVKLQSCGFGEQEYFTRLHERDSRQLNGFMRVMCSSSVICPFFFCLSVPLFGLLEGDYRTKAAVPTQCAFERHTPGVYELIIFHQFLGLALPGVQKLGHECTVIALFKIHGSYFKYLSVTLSRFGEELALDRAGAGQAFRSWLSLHQDVVRSSINIIEFYSPVIMTYLLSIAGMVGASVFYLLNLLSTAEEGGMSEVYRDSMVDYKLWLEEELKLLSVTLNSHMANTWILSFLFPLKAKAPEANSIQTGFLGAYMYITMFRLFLQCLMAEELSTQANFIADAIYDLPWYNFKREYKKSILQVLILAGRPLKVEAYRSPGFSLSPASFQSFFTNTISACLAFNRMIEHV